MSTTTSSSKYRDATEQVSAYNSKMLVERRMRIPYIDGQTGVAQQDCHIFVSRVQRCLPKREGQLFSYPARRWWIKKRPNFFGNDNEETAKTEEPELEEQKEELPSEDIKPVIPETIPLMAEEQLSAPQTSQLKEEVINEDEAFTDEQMILYEEGGYSDESDHTDEEFQPSSKRRRSKAAVPSKKAPPGKLNSLALKLMEKLRQFSREEVGMMDAESRKKPYICEICQRCYKSYCGIRHHYQHYNHDADVPQPPQPHPSQMDEPVNPMMMMQTVASAHFPSMPPMMQMPIPQQHQQQHLPHLSHPLVQQQMPPMMQQQHMTHQMHQQHPPEMREHQRQRRAASPNPYCDFCLGDKTENKKTQQAEELLSCADCGRSGHPSCLQFTAKLTAEVKKYNWQCIECKSCSICGTSDNDDQLLFCDECDRGYHMYCLQPPMNEPPEGHWCCKLCENRPT